MNLDELQSVRDRERQSDSLQQLRDSFYADAGELIGELRAQRDQAATQSDDPFDDPEVSRITDDINTAEQTVEAIYERRVGKLVKMASFAAADMPTEDEGLTAEERELFEGMVESIERNRDRVFAILDGEDPGDLEPIDRAGASGATADPSPVESETPAEPAPEPDRAPTGEKAGAEGSGVDAADLMGSGEEPTESESTEQGATADAQPGETDEKAGGGDRPVPPQEATAGDRADESTTDPTAGRAADEDDTAGESPTPRSDGGGETADDGGSGVDRRTVRITQDVGEILGVDQRAYDLASEDVVTLPAANADPLVERDAAEPLDR
ncbi:hypothetical protein [Halorientalis halophila]|uniref:DNA replication complex subunit Gins51 n=1 Tax=Halorientalis halophila TaxID=3108499 RepID=UPI00300AE28F